MIRRLFMWVALIAAAATSAIAINLVLLHAASSGREPVGKQSARTSFVRLRPSRGILHPPPRHARGLEADD